MSKINLHISSNFFKLLCIGKRCFQPEVAKSSHIMCFMDWAPMLVQIFPWTGVSDYQKLHLVAPATADKFLIEKHTNKLFWRHLWTKLFFKKSNIFPPPCQVKACFFKGLTSIVVAAKLRRVLRSALPTLGDSTGRLSSTPTASATTPPFATRTHAQTTSQSQQESQHILQPQPRQTLLVN